MKSYEYNQYFHGSGARKILESKTIFASALALIIGVVGLALWFSPAIYIGAAGYLFTRFRLTPSKIHWLISTVVVGVISVAVYFGGFYISQRYYAGLSHSVIINHMQMSWVLMIAASVVTHGLISSLFIMTSFASELAAYREKYGDMTYFLWGPPYGKF